MRYYFTNIETQTERKYFSKVTNFVAEAKLPSKSSDFGWISSVQPQLIGTPALNGLNKSRNGHLHWLLQQLRRVLKHPDSFHFFFFSHFHSQCISFACRLLPLGSQDRYSGFFVHCCLGRESKNYSPPTSTPAWATERGLIEQSSAIWDCQPLDHKGLSSRIS